MEAETIALAINASLTLFVGIFLLYRMYVKKVEKNFLYLIWSIGFLFYGIEIGLKLVIDPSQALNGSNLLLSILATIFFLCFTLGLASLNRKKLVSILVTAVIFMIIAVFSTPIFGVLSHENASILIFFLYFIPSIILMIYNRASFGRSIDRLILGWGLLLMVNILFRNTGWVINISSAFIKVFLLAGMLDPDFTLLATKIKVSSTLPLDTGYPMEGGFSLISVPSVSKVNRVDWIRNKILKNIETDIYTYIFSFQGVIPHAELRRIKWIKPDRTFIFLFSSSAEKVKNEFTVMPFDLTQIGAAVSGVIKKHSNLGNGCTLIFSDMSLLIHLFGTYAVYKVILSKMSSLREESVKLYGFFHHKTHSDKSIPALFESIADEVIRL
jgi:hypothetical protein